jgi:hypothetical protein
MEKILKSLISKINNNEQDSIILNDLSNKKIKIDKSKFNKINFINSNKKISFIDGGNLEIIKSPSISLFFNRIYYSTYQNNKRVENKQIEFFTLISTINKNDIIYYKTEYEFINGYLDLQEYEFNSFDKLLITNNKRANISLVGNIIRRFSELLFTKQIISDYIVLDGSLEITYPFEEELINNLNKNKIYGLSKTNKLITQSGNSIIPILHNLSTLNIWSYDFSHSNFYSYFVKLHKNSKYIFRFDSFQNEMNNEIFSLLVNNSSDPIFLGYPYGLIDADKFARVTKNEQEMLFTKIKMKKEFKKLLPYINMQNSHDILDNM